MNMIGGIQVIMVNVGVKLLKNEMCKSSLLLTEDITLKLLVTKNVMNPQRRKSTTPFSVLIGAVVCMAICGIYHSNPAVEECKVKKHGSWDDVIRFVKSLDLDSVNVSILCNCSNRAPRLLADADPTLIAPTITHISKCYTPVIYRSVEGNSSHGRLINQTC